MSSEEGEKIDMKVRWKEAYRVQSEITTKEPKRKRQVLEITVNGDK
jgi:hypothetical protein